MLHLRNICIPFCRKTMTLFGIVGIITFPLFYFIWGPVLFSEANGQYLRLLAFAVCIPLAFNSIWPHNYSKYLHAYWSFSVFLCIPFFGTYMFLLNKGSPLWSFNIVCGLVWLALLSNWKSCLFHLFFGIIFGSAVYTTFHGYPVLEGENLLVLSLNYVWTVFIVALFSRNREELIRQKMLVTRTLSGTIAHESNTSILGLQGVLHSLRNRFQNQESDQASSLDFLDPKVGMILDRFDLHLKNLRFNINSLRTNLQNLSAGKTYSSFSMKRLVDQALEIYPLKSSEVPLVSLETKNDFTINTDETLFAQAIANLIKNALYAVHSQNERIGEILISINSSDNGKFLTIKDNGVGISHSTAKHLFDPFVTTKMNGMGLGLSFVKKVVEASKGRISFTSQEGKGTEFILKF